MIQQLEKKTFLSYLTYTFENFVLTKFEKINEIPQLKNFNPFTKTRIILIDLMPNKLICIV